MRYLLATLMLALPLAGFAGGPGDAVAAALADVRTLPPTQQQNARYLWMGNMPLAQREDLLRVTAFWANSLSRAPEIVPPTTVGAELIRLHLADYDWKVEVWEKLAAIDPYFHVQTETAGIERWGIPDGNGGWKNVEERKVAKKKTSIHVALPDEKTAGALVSLTQSQAPIVRADWWLAQVARQLSLTNKQTGAGYYDWLGIKDRKDFEKLIRLSAKDSADLGKEMRAAVDRSGVATQNRQVVRLQSLTGGAWATLDTNDGTGEGNAVRNLKAGTFKHQAEEHYGTLPNGLFAFLLCDNEGVRQDTAPDFIGADSSLGRQGNDARIHAGLSCVRCHVEGLRGIDDFIRRQPKVVSSPDYAELVQLRRQYFSNLNRQLDRDRSVYQESLQACNGLKPAANAKAVSEVWNRYVEELVGPERAAEELGVPVETLRRKLAGTGDVLLAGLAATPPAPMTRTHLEESAGLLMQAVYGGKP